MISIQWPVLVLVFLDETILGLCLLKEFAFECRWIPLINPQWTPLASWSTPSWRLHWYSVNSWLTVGGQSTFFHRHAFECWPMSHLANYQPTYNQCQSRCWLSVNLVSIKCINWHLTTDAFCTHDLNSEDLLALLTFSLLTCTLPVKESKQCRYFWQHYTLWWST